MVKQFHKLKVTYNWSSRPRPKQECFCAWFRLEWMRFHWSVTLLAAIYWWGKYYDSDPLLRQSRESCWLQEQVSFTIWLLHEQIGETKSKKKKPSHCLNMTRGDKISFTTINYVIFASPFMMFVEMWLGGILNILDRSMISFFFWLASTCNCTSSMYQSIS